MSDDAGRVDRPSEQSSSPPTARRPGFEPATTPVRLLAGGLGAGCLGVLGLAAGMTPSPDGHGTHTQLGMTDCMWAMALDRPCPTCGMTTAFAYAGDGHFLQSFLTQPMGFILAICTSTFFWGAMHVAATGSRLGSAISGLLGPRPLILFGVLLLGAWAYKFVAWS